MTHLAQTLTAAAPILVVAGFIAMAAWTVTAILSDTARDMRVAEELGAAMGEQDWADEPTALFDQMADQHPWVKAELAAADMRRELDRPDAVSRLIGGAS